MSAIRRPGAASAAVLIGLTTSLLVAHAVAPKWSRRAGLDVWNIPTLEADYRAAGEELADMDAHAERSARRRETATQIATQLAAGDTTLAAATDAIRTVFADDRGLPTALEFEYRDIPSERLRFARHVIDRVGRLLNEDPSRLVEVTARLEAEYRAMAAEGSAP